MVAALVVVALGEVSVGAAVVARHRAQAAADLAALGAAGRLADGPDAACRQARSLSAVMHTTLTGCQIESLDVVVTVDVRPGGWAVGIAQAAARAGPVARR